VEKPFGHDLPSAHQLVTDLHACLDETNLFRIDHYLGKETVQNLLYFRFANSIWEPIWNSNLIDNVQITVAEQEGVGTRGAFYDGVGAMRDMVQNHMMQLLSITAMEPPANLTSQSIHDEKVKVLRSITTPKIETIRSSTVRAQYEGYRQTDRVNPNSSTETYAALKIQIDNWRWSGVPFYLRTGKALTTRASEIVIVFRRPPAALFRAPRQRARRLPEVRGRGERQGRLQEGGLLAQKDKRGRLIRRPRRVGGRRPQRRCAGRHFAEEARDERRGH
jgi:glucose-6-phosphate 1-dehydrogenase